MRIIIDSLGQRYRHPSSHFLRRSYLLIISVMANNFISNDKDTSSKYFSLKLKIFLSAFRDRDDLDLVFLEIEFQIELLYLFQLWGNWNLNFRIIKTKISHQYTDSDPWRIIISELVERTQPCYGVILHCCLQRVQTYWLPLHCTAVKTQNSI